MFNVYLNIFLYIADGESNAVMLGLKIIILRNRKDDFKNQMNTNYNLFDIGDNSEPQNLRLEL